VTAKEREALLETVANVEQRMSNLERAQTIDTLRYEVALLADVLWSLLSEDEAEP
jgi:hypothetical protein